MVAAGLWSFAPGLALAGGLLELAAVCCFVAQMVVTFWRSGQRFEPMVGFIMTALVCFVASIVMSVWHTWTTMTAAPEDLLWYISTYQSPLRDLQVHGLALFMILGVSVRMMSALYDVPRPSNRRSWWAWGFLVTALLSEVTFFLAYRWTDNHALAGGLLLAWALFAVGVARIVLPWRPWRPFPIQDRTSKFVRAAFGWLAVSLAMLLFLPIYLMLSQVPFSHAYYGATRHAITVGFVSLMIMGMGAKVVPTLKGIPPVGLPNLLGPFVLMNLGCALRVTTQILTDWTSNAYSIIGVSGTLEVIGLTWWGVGLIRLMLRNVDEAPAAVLNPSARPVRIEPQHIVADVLDWFPETLPVFERHGFTALRQPLLRKTLARQVTLAQASRMKSVNIDEFLNDLNHMVKARPSPKPSPAGLLPIIVLPGSGS
jgi:multisubunit Na+/H+ antiporter MnhB subunit